MKKTYFLYVFIAFLFAQSLHSQCSLYPVSLANRVNSSSLIIQGRVVSHRSFQNSAQNYIYTSNLIRVSQVLKGSLASELIEVITDGGEVGLMKQVVEPSLQLRQDEEGVFTLNSFQQPSQFGYPVFNVYADQQGFIKFDLTENTARDPFKKYNDINTDLYPELQKLIGALIPSYVNPTSPGKGYGSGVTTAVTGISPTVITAGTFSVLTITGSGFGSTQGTSFVEFFNADDGGATYIKPDPSQYVSWSSTQIQVMVPTRTSTLSGTAGTGPVRVTVSASSTVSSQNLTVDYGELNVLYSGAVYNTRHVDLNGSSGITWQMYTSFDANSAAKTAFLNSFQTWRCNTYINWVLGSTVSTNTIALDGVNVIRFDVGSELPGGVLGRCTSYYSGCIVGSNVYFYVEELDIVFDDPSTSAITWQFGPTPASGTQYDFESVSLHELGHGHQLSHVINSSDVMHYALANAQNKRSLITNNINGGGDVMARNVSGGVCSIPAMSALNSTNCSISAPSASFSVSSPVCVGQTVSMTDLSSGTPASWSWTITGGSTSTSTLQNPTTTYASAGTYTISLMATNGFGSSSVYSKTVSVLAQPTISIPSATLCSGSSTMLTASGATSYTWNPGGLTGASQSLNPSSTTVYTVTGSNGVCSASSTGTVTITTTPTVSISNAAICSGSSTLMTASGATSYTWNPGGLTGSSQNLNPSSTTPYTVTATSGTCSASPAAFTITVNSTPTLSVPNSTICSGNSTLVTASGATTYTWNPGNLTGTSQNLNPSGTTTYTITGGIGTCTSSTNMTITVNASPTINVANANICSGSPTVLTASGATSFTWNPGGLTGVTQTLNPSSTTVYTIDGSNGTCGATTTNSVNVTTTPTVVAPNGFVCFGSSTTIVASGAASYIWNPGGLTGVSQNLFPGTYTVIGANGNCFGSTQILVSGAASINVNVPNASLCSGTSTVLTASGAGSYVWNPGNLSGATQTLSPGITTTYTVTGTVGTCTNNGTTIITVTTTPTVSVPNGAICSGNSTLMTASGASSYIWNPGSLSGASQNLNPSSTTIYTVTGNNGICSHSVTTTVSVTTTPTVLVSNASLCSGTSTLLVAGGANSYVWNPGNLSGAAQNLSPGTTTTYTVTGAIGTCTGNATSVISVTTTPTVSVPNALICSGNGTLVTASGASSYVWNPGSLSGASQSLSPGATTGYTVTGSNGICSNTAAMTVSVNVTPTVSVVSSTSACYGNSITLTASGAGTYSWNPAGLTGASIILGGAPGSTVYTVTGTSNNCSSSSKTVAVTVRALPSLFAISSPTAICPGNTSTLAAAGAVNYTWAPGSLTGTSVAVSPTITTVYTITGNDGFCNNVINLQLVVNPTPTLSIANTSVCSTSSTVMTVSGANTYTWNPGGLTGTSQTLTPTSTTIYTLVGTSTAGCISASKAVTLTAIPLPGIFAIATPTAICPGVTSTLSAGGGISYTWTPGSLTGANVGVTPTVSTMYTVSASDGTCIGRTTVPVTVNPTPTISVASSTLCSNTSYSLNASGANSYTWNPGNLTSGSVVLNSTTIFTITGQNSFNCLGSTTATVSVTPTPTLNAGPSTQVTCSGKSLTLSATGATNYTWNPGSTTSPTTVITPTTNTTYTVIGANANCISSTQIFVVVNPNPVISFSNAPSSCSGNSVFISAFGANSYTWSGGPVSSTIVVAPTVTTTYSVTGSYSSTGCSAGGTVTILVSSNPSINVIASSTVICFGNSVTLIANGGTSYTWTPGSLTGSSVTVAPTVSTLYQVTGISGSCTASSAVVVLVNSNPTLSAVSNVTSICSGNTVILTTSGANSYTWVPGNLVGQTVTVSPTTSTTYTAIGTFSNTGCTSSKTIAIGVTTTPTLNAAFSPSISCAGKPTTITASGASSYVWTPGGPTPSIVVSPSISTVYALSGSNSSCTSVRQVTLSVNPNPVLSVNASTNNFCSGGTSLLSATGANSYTWNPGNSFFSSISVTPLSTTVYTVTGAFNSTGCYTENSVTVNVIPTPTVVIIVSNQLICIGDPVVLSSTGATTFTYQPGNVSGSTATFSPLTSVAYTVTGENSGCFGTTVATVSVQTCTSLKEQNWFNNLRVYPNPANDQVRVDFGESFSGEIRLYNVIGQLLRSEEINSIENFTFDISTFSKGIYFIRLSTDTNKGIFVKVVKE
jgi:hypothetical protein